MRFEDCTSSHRVLAHLALPRDVVLEVVDVPGRRLAEEGHLAGQVLHSSAGLARLEEE